MATKFVYKIEDLRCNGIDDLQAFIDKAHRNYSPVSVRADNDAKDAYKIYRYIVDNEISNLRNCMDYIFSNNLWSAWRRGQSTFKDLIRENARYIENRTNKERRRVYMNNIKRQDANRFIYEQISF